MSELTDAEFWILLSLDAEQGLFELLMPIVQVEGRRQRQIRPELTVTDAAQALVTLVARGFVEIRASQVFYDWEAGRVVTADEVQAAAGDPLTWRVPSEVPEGRETYWAVITAEGEAAYGAGSEARRRDSIG